MCSFFYRHDFKQFLILCVLTGKTCCMSHLIQSSVLCASGFYSLLKMEALFFSETPDYKMLLYKAHNIDITAHTTFILTLYFALTTSPVTPRTPQTQTHTSVMVWDDLARNTKKWRKKGMNKLPSTKKQTHHVHVQATFTRSVAWHARFCCL